MWILEKKNLDKFLEKWDSENQVFIPSRIHGDIALMPFRIGKLDLDYINFAQPVKEFIFKSKEDLFEWETAGNATLITSLAIPEHERYHNIIFGVRACDALGIAYMDRFFQGEFCEDKYKINRNNTLIAALNCVKSGESCFCHSLGTGPFASSGYDVLFTPLEGKYLVETQGDKGKALIELGKEFLVPTTKQNDTENSVEKTKLFNGATSKFKTKMESLNLRKVLEESFDDEIWSELAAKCIRCGGCTNVCPTCTCYNVVEEKTSENGGKRVRYWDSCQCDSFTRNAGGHKTRSDISRVRYRIYDKLKYIEERFEHKGCTGCGRCITACPVDIDIVNIVNRLTDKYEAEKSSIEQSRRENSEDEVDRSGFNIQEHKKCEEVYLPEIAVITDIIQETRSIKRFILEYENKRLHDKFEFGGQFFELSVFGVGEIAISIPFSGKQRGYFDFCIKNVGKVTKALHNMKIGDKIGLRGPFGKGFPVEEMKGRDIIIVGSGVGVAPIRTAVVQIAESRKKYGKVVVIGSAISYENLIYKSDFADWQKMNMKVFYALSKPTDQVEAHLGYINDLLPGLDFNWRKTSAIICASPKRIKEVAKDLIKLGMNGQDIYTSLETHMRCGIGKCGHCKVGNKYMCVDGPVFNYEEMLKLPPEF